MQLSFSRSCNSPHLIGLLRLLLLKGAKLIVTPRFCMETWGRAAAGQNGVQPPHWSKQTQSLPQAHRSASNHWGGPEWPVLTFQIMLPVTAPQGPPIQLAFCTCQTDWTMVDLLELEGCNGGDKFKIHWESVQWSSSWREMWVGELSYLFKSWVIKWASGCLKGWILSTNKGITASPL